MDLPQVAITGLGAVSPFGLTVDEFWDGICQGRCGIDKITAFDASKLTCKIAGQVPDFKIRNFVPKSYRKATKLMSRDIELSVVAAREAVKSAGLITKDSDETPNIDPDKTAVNFGAGLISCDLEEMSLAIGSTSITDGKFDIHKWGKDGINALTPLWLLKYLPNMPACHIGIIHDIQGPSNSITCGEVGSHIAIAEARQVIQRGSADVALAGGGEAKVNPIILLRQCLLERVTTQYQDTPEKACRPFDADAAGCVFGEGAGLVVLENLDRAKNRGAKIHAVIAGFGQSNSLNPVMHHLEPDGKGLTIAIEKALAEAGITGNDIDLIIPHGTAIACDDIAESRAIENALGDAVRQIPALPIKSMVSNTGAASGVLDVIAGACAMRSSTIPAAMNCENIAQGCSLNINRTTQQKDIKFVLCTGYTFGGQTAALILKNING